MKNVKPISGWVINELGFSVSEHCYPDYLPGEYDWRKDFEVDKVIERGEIIARRPVGRIPTPSKMEKISA